MGEHLYFLRSHIIAVSACCLLLAVGVGVYVVSHFDIPNLLVNFVFFNRTLSWKHIKLAWWEQRWKSSGRSRQETYVKAHILIQIKLCAVLCYAMLLARWLLHYSSRSMVLSCGFTCTYVACIPNNTVANQLLTLLFTFYFIYFHFHPFLFLFFSYP